MHVRWSAFRMKDNPTITGSLSLFAQAFFLVSDRAGFGCGMGTTYPYLTCCGGVAGEMTPAPCPTPPPPLFSLGQRLVALHRRCGWRLKVPTGYTNHTVHKENTG